MSTSARAVFLDRDGILNEMVYDETHGLLDSPRRPEQVRVIAGAGAFIRGVKSLGYKVIVATNQPGIAKGTLTEEELAAVNQCLANKLAEEDAAWDDLYFSPYHPDGGTTPRPDYVRQSECRKPAPGMLLQAAKKYGLDLGESWMVGDGLTDVQAGLAAGCRTILVTRLKVDMLERWLELKAAEPHSVAPDMVAALAVVRAG